MDYWKEAEKIYTDLERKGYRMDFESNNGDEHHYSYIYFMEKGNERDENLLSIHFNFKIEELLLTSNKKELEEKFAYASIFIYDETKGKQLAEYLINEFKFDYFKINGCLLGVKRYNEPFKMFCFYVTVAEKYYSSIFSKVKNSIGKEG